MKNGLSSGKTKVYLRNLGANWVGYGVKLIVTFFLAPFVVHKLGKSLYGVWTLLVSLTGYMGLLELGIMSSTSRYINFYIAKKDWKNLSRVINTNLITYLVISLFLLTSATIIGPHLGKIFQRIPNSLLVDARLILIIFSINIFLGFVSATFRHLLQANDRFDLTNISNLTVLAFYAFGTVLVLQSGYGIVALAVVHMISNVVGSILLILLSFNYGPPFELKTSFINKGTFRELFQFGIFAFIADIGSQLIFYTDSLVIGLFIGAVAITFYNIPLMLIEYARTLVKQFQYVLSPDLLKIGGSEDPGSEKWFVIKSIRFSMFFAIPLLIGFLTLGKEFIVLWMGQDFVKSFPVLQILSVSQFFSIASFSCYVVLMGIGRVKFLAAVSIFEGTINLFLSILLIKTFNMGIIGVALGTLLPMSVFSGVIVSLYACRTIKCNLFEFASLTLFRWLAAAIVFLIPCLIAKHLPFPPSWLVFWVKISILSVVYLAVGIPFLIPLQDRILIKEVIMRRIKPSVYI